MHILCVNALKVLSVFFGTRSVCFWLRQVGNLTLILQMLFHSTDDLNS